MPEGPHTQPKDMDSKPPWCRQLFPVEGVVGVPASAVEERIQEERVQEERQRNRERWNFDFELGVPLEGQYEWIRVSPPSPPLPIAREVSGGGRSRPAAEQEVAPEAVEEGEGGEVEEGEEDMEMAREEKEEEDDDDEEEGRVGTTSPKASLLPS